MGQVTKDSRIVPVERHFKFYVLPTDGCEEFFAGWVSEQFPTLNKDGYFVFCSGNADDTRPASFLVTSALSGSQVLGWRTVAIPLEAAAEDEGWIDWTGGECPLPSGQLVDIRLADGDQLANGEAGDFYWGVEAGDPGRRIVAYRIVK